MADETEWEYRNRLRAEALAHNVYTFSSHHNAKELKHLRRVLLRNILLALLGTLVLLVILISIIIHYEEECSFGESFTKSIEMFSGIFADTRFWKESTHVKLLGMFFLLNLVSVISSTMVEFRRYKVSYAKEIVIDFNTNKISYTDDSAQLTFYSNQIKEWIKMHSVHKKHLGDMFILQDGQKINLDGFYTKDLHVFLEEHAEKLQLPKCRWITKGEM